MAQTAKSKKDKKRMNIDLPITLHDQFKAATAANGDNMTDVLTAFIKNYVEKNGIELKKKARR